MVMSGAAVGARIYPRLLRDMGIGKDKIETILMSNGVPSKSVFATSSPILGYCLRYPMLIAYATFRYVRFAFGFGNKYYFILIEKNGYAL